MVVLSFKFIYLNFFILDRPNKSSVIPVSVMKRSKRAVHCSLVEYTIISKLIIFSDSGVVVGSTVASSISKTFFPQSVGASPHPGSGHLLSSVDRSGPDHQSFLSTSFVAPGRWGSLFLDNVHMNTSWFCFWLYTTQLKTN